MTSVRVPGKVMLSGEYAVLYGGTAVMIPVNRWLTAASDPTSDIDSLTPVTRAVMELPIPELAEIEQSLPPPCPVIDSSEFFLRAGRTRIKLGLGASSAEAVATTALRFELAGQPWQDRRDLVFHYARLAHQNVQSGLGSGADVAACCYGTPLYYRLFENKFQVSPIVAPHRHQHPAVLVWSGHSADTRVLLDRFMAWAEGGGSIARQLIGRLVESSNIVAGAWFQASWDELFELLSEFVVILSRCAREAGVPYKIQAHREIESWAIKLGGKAKPVGAGGGDMVLVLGDLPWSELDRPVIPLQI